MTRNDVYKELTTSAEVLLFIYILRHKDFSIKDEKFLKELSDKGVTIDQLRRAIRTLLSLGIIERETPRGGKYGITVRGLTLTPTPTI